MQFHWEKCIHPAILELDLNKTSRNSVLKYLPISEYLVLLSVGFVSSKIAFQSKYSSLVIERH